MTFTKTSHGVSTIELIVTTLLLKSVRENRNKGGLNDYLSAISISMDGARNWRKISLINTENTF
jgi:hypothetical protein